MVMDNELKELLAELEFQFAFAEAIEETYATEVIDHAVTEGLVDLMVQQTGPRTGSSYYVITDAGAEELTRLRSMPAKAEPSTPKPAHWGTW